MVFQRSGGSRESFVGIYACKRKEQRDPEEDFQRNNSF